MATTQRPNDDLEAQSVDHTSTETETNDTQKPRKSGYTWRETEREWRHYEPESRRWFRPR